MENDFELFLAKTKMFIERDFLFSLKNPKEIDLQSSNRWDM